MVDFFSPSTILGAAASLSASLILHECGHLAAAKLAGVPIRSIGISWKGPYIQRGRSPIPIVDASVSMAGVIVNLLLVALFWSLLPDFARINLQVGLVNAMPFVPYSDGRNAWRRLRDAT